MRKILILLLLVLDCQGATRATPATQKYTVLLTWNLATGINVKHQYVYRQKAACKPNTSPTGTWNWKATLSPEVNSYTDNQVFEGETYCYYVAAETTLNVDYNSKTAKAVIPKNSVK